MGVHYANAKKGNKFEITYVGKHIRSVADKFKDGSIAHKQYKYHVPKTWLTNGYVTEIKDEGE